MEKRTSKDILAEIRAAHEREFDTESDDTIKAIREMRDFVDKMVEEGGFTRQEAIMMLVELARPRA